MAPHVLRWIHRLTRFAAWVAAALFAAIGLIVFYEVAMRHAFLAPTSWVEETARVLQIYGVFLAAAWLVGRREHIRITVLTAQLPPTARVWLSRAALLAIGAVAGVSAWYGLELMLFSIDIGQTTDTTLELPMWLLQGPVVAGLVLIALQVLATVVGSFRAPELLGDDPPQSGV